MTKLYQELADKEYRPTAADRQKIRKQFKNEPDMKSFLLQNLGPYKDPKRSVLKYVSTLTPLMKSKGTISAQTARDLRGIIEQIKQSTDPVQIERLYTEWNYLVLHNKVKKMPAMPQEFKAIAQKHKQQKGIKKRSLKQIVIEQIRAQKLAHAEALSPADLSNLKPWEDVVKKSTNPALIEEGYQQWTKMLNSKLLKQGLHKDFDFGPVQVKEKAHPYKHFNITHVTLNISEPSYDPEYVKGVVRRFFDKNLGKLEGQYINIQLHLDKANYPYNTGEFTPKSVDDVIKHFTDTAIHNWQFDKAHPREGSGKDWEEFAVDKITILISERAGGCSEGCADFRWADCTEKERSKSKYLNPIDPLKRNNCAIMAIILGNAYTDCQTKHESFSKYVNEDKINDFGGLAAKIKQEVYPELAEDALIPTNKMKRLEKHFKCGINIWEFNGTHFNIIRATKRTNKTIHNLLLRNGHYVWVKRPDSLEIGKCPNCKRGYRYLQEHLKECFWCEKCKGPKKYEGPHDPIECADAWEARDFSDTRVKRKKLHKEFKALNQYITADLETFVQIDHNGRLTPYAIGFAFNDKEPSILYGPDCLDDFIDILNKVQRKTYLIWYNGCRFDLFFLKQRLLELGIKCDSRRSNGAIKKLWWKKIVTWDLNLHITGSLASNCEEYKIGADDKKGEFDHALIECWEDVQEYKYGQVNLLGKVVNGWYDYLIQDVRALRALFKLYANKVWEKFHVNCTDFMTLSSMSFYIWQTRIDRNITIPLLTDEWDRFVRKSIYGGRCYPVKQHFKGESDGSGHHLRYFDVCSLYPASMLNQFPVGEYKTSGYDKNVNKKEKMVNWLNNKSWPKNWMAIVECDVEANHGLIQGVLPHHDENGGNRWEVNDINRGVYNTVDLQRAVAHGYTIKKIYKYILWTKTAEVFSSYINEVYEWKEKSEKDSPDYLLAKLFMNSLYGKMLQRPINTQTAIVKDYAQLEKLRSENYIEWIDLIKDNLAMVHMCKKDANTAVTKPSYHGSFILGYSRQIMDKYFDAIGAYDNIDTSIYYTDTDSILVGDREAQILHKFVAQGQIGTLSYECPGKIIHYDAVGPKNYGIKYVCDMEKKNHVIGQTYTSIKMKGIIKDVKKKLTMDHMDFMLFGGDAIAESKIYDKHNNMLATLSGKDKKLEANMTGRLKKLSNLPNKPQQAKGHNLLDIVSEDQKRSVRQTMDSKRTRISGPYIASLPFGYKGPYEQLIVGQQ